MSFTEGADLEALGQSATKLSDIAKRIDDVTASVGKSVGRLKSTWGGDDYGRFATQYTSQIQPSLSGVAQGIVAMAEVLRSEVGEQGAGSDGAGSGSFGGGEFGGGGASGSWWNAGAEASGPTSGFSMERSGIVDLVERDKLSAEEYAKKDHPDAKVTLVEGSVSADASVYRNKGDNYDVRFLSAEATANAGVTIEDGRLYAAVGVAASAMIGSATVGGSYGPASGSVSAMVGAEGSAEGKLGIGPDGFAASAHAEAFAGAKAEVQVGADLGVGKVSGTLEGYAGAGVKFDAEATFKNGKIESHVEMGAALGLGLGYSFDVSIDTGFAGKAAAELGKGLSSFFRH